MRRDELVALLEGERERGSFPSWQALVAEGERVLFEGAGGSAVLEPERVPASDSTLYDLASLTKPLCSALLALHLAEEGVLPLEMPLARLLTEREDRAFERMTALDLLTHRCGLPAWRALYLETRGGPERFARAAAASPLESEPGRTVRYSDLGFLLLGAALERAAGLRLEQLFERHIRPLAGGEPLLFSPPTELRPGIAATERGNEFERTRSGAPPGDPRFRRELIWGQVHDGNAFAMGGVAPHAGLFGTARAVHRVALGYLDGSGLLGSAGKWLARSNLTAGQGAARSAAFELALGEGTAGSGVLPPEAVGHSGFTGTSLWIEPGRGRIYVLLTNRVHPVVQEMNLNAVRRRFHAAAATL